jgi:hypothetical protein
VSCRSSTLCVAVGQSAGSQGNTRALTEVRQGGTWKIITNPSP